MIIYSNESPKTFFNKYRPYFGGSSSLTRKEKVYQYIHFGVKTNDKICIYNYESLIMVRSHFIKQNADFQEGISQAQSIATPLPTLIFLTTNKSF